MKLALIIILTSLLHFSPNRSVEKWIIGKESNLCIEGKSNVNKFQCNIKEYLGADTLDFFKTAPGDEQYLVKGGMIVRLDGFKCGQKFMNDDFQKTLKAKESPFLTIQLKSIDNFINSSHETGGNVLITLAGIKKNIIVKYTINKEDYDKVQLNGTCRLLFSDFGLTPPRKLGGLIKVQEEIIVRFTLVLNPIKS